ncbi:hypothetical protein [Anabaena sp. PCC 7108]|uniref:hypothetical protein n=1 Tax=Anabaena sp. PCC 7108 TaxID=163908 RepID=UPI00034DACBA|nr:hypothetical protein [Anabaena sp. PCC 7108]
MSYANRLNDDMIPTETAIASRVTEYHDRVRWGPIISGVLVGLAAQQILSAFFGALGAGRIANSLVPRSIAPGIASNVGLWSTLALLISLFLGGWVTTRGCGIMNRNTAFLNGAILWATTLALSSWLSAIGVMGTFGVVVSNAGEFINQVQQSASPVPQNLSQLTPEQARELAAVTSRTLWWYVFGSLLGLAMAVIGAVSGARTPRTNNYNH